MRALRFWGSGCPCRPGFRSARSPVRWVCGCTGGPSRLLATAEHPLAGELAIRYLAGGGLDLTRVEARGGGDAVWLAPEKYVLVPVVRAAAELRAHLSRMFALSFLLLADLDTSGTRFVVEGGAEDVVLLRPFAVRPGIGLAVTTP